MQVPIRSLCMFAILLTLVGFGWALFPPQGSDLEGSQAPQMAPPPEALRVALLAKDTEKALELLTELDSSEPKNSDGWSFYRAVALQDAARNEEANETLKKLIQAHPNSAWVQKALYRRAEVCQRLGLFEESEAIYREAASRLRSTDRQSELAGIYVELAARLAQVEESNPNAPAPRYAEAIGIYQQALDLEIHRDLRAKVLEDMGRCATGLQQHAQAARYFARVGELELPVENSLRWKAIEAVGQQHIAAKQFSAALRTMEDFLRDAEQVSIDPVQHPQAHAALQSALASAHRVIGNAWLGQKRLPLALGAWRKGLEAFPQDPERAQVLHTIAQALESAGRTDEAVDAWETLARSQPNTERADPKQWEILKRQAQFQKASTQANAKRFDEALQSFREYIRLFPNGEKWSESQTRIVDLEHRIAYRLQEEKKWAPARRAMSAFVLAYPLDSRVQRTQLDRARSYHLEALAGETTDLDLVRKSIEELSKVAQTYPRSDIASQALFLSAQAQEAHLQDMVAAVTGYKQIQFGKFQSKAQAALERLTRSELTIQTERIVRTGEAAKIKVQVRNVENLDVQIYPLNLESYYRKHHTYQGIENLDLDLIAPDQRIDHKVPAYQAYAPIEFDLALPLEGPGVWAIAIASETDRATTLVIRSDIDIVAKTSKREAFVYAQNMLTGTPAEGVRVMMSRLKNGEPELLEWTTDAQGIARWEAPENQPLTKKINLLASIGGHMAATDLDPSKLRNSAALGPRSLIYADRPAYQPGETLRWRTIVRTLENGLWHAPKEQICQVHLLDSNGLVVAKTEATLGEFGTASGAFSLPKTAPTGEWTLYCRMSGAESVRQTIRVEPFRLPRAEIVLSAESTVVWRGDKIRVEALAQTTYGAPLANTPIRWIHSGKQEETITGPDGMVAIELETREYASDQTIQVSAHLPTENVTSQLALFVATRGFQPKLTVQRSVELLGSSFPVTVSAKTPDGKGAERTLQLRAFKRTGQGNGRWSEEVLFEREINTGTNGEITFPIALQQSGLIYLEVHGTDRFGNTVYSKKSLTISGEDDQIPLRLLTQESQASPGQTIVMQAINRSRAGVALLTLETDRVLEHSLIRLEPGTNSIEVTARERMAPNMRVALSYMDQDAFHEAETVLEIVQPLTIRFEESAQTPTPGQSQTFHLSVTDAQGVPVRTELSLAAVDEALYALYPDKTPRLDRHFKAAPRAFPLMRTESSCQFSYKGETRAIALSILDERQRVEQERSWREDRSQLVEQLAAPGAVPAELGEEAEEIAVQSFRQAKNRNSRVGVGGGSGGRFGGRRNLNAKGMAPTEKQSGPPQSALAFWQADIVTDPKGKAIVTIPWPARSTRWRLTAHGVAATNHFGTATKTQTLQDDFFLELLAPQHLVEGDRPQIAVQIHDASQKGGQATLQLTVQGPDGEQRQERTIDLDQVAIHRLVFEELESLEPGQNITAKVRLTTIRDGQTVLREAQTRMHVRPAGIVVYDQVTGVLTDLETITLNLEGTQREIELHFGAHLSHVLMQAALGESPRPYRCLWSSGPAELASDLFGALAVARSTEFYAGHPRYDDLKARIQSLIASLSAEQRVDGGWSWQGRHGNRDAYTTAHVSLALGLAKKMGWAVEDKRIQSMRNALHQETRNAPSGSDELKAHLHHALAMLGEADFAALNRLHRAQNELSVAGKAHLALALNTAGRKSMALEIVRILPHQASRGEIPESRTWGIDTSHPWYGGPLESNAWAILAIQTVLEDRTETTDATRFLINRLNKADRKASGIVIWAVSQQFAGPQGNTPDGLITVTMQGATPQRVPISSSPDASGQVIKIALPDAAAGSTGAKVQIKLQLEGSQAPTYQIIAKAIQPATPTQEAPGFSVRYKRLLPDAPRYLGKEIQTGFNTIRQAKPWTNTREQVRKGEVVRLEIRAQRNSTRNKLRNQRHDYLELEVPIPAGLEWLETQDPAERKYRRVGQSLVFPLGALRGSFQTTIELVGVHEGNYQFPPAIVRSVYRPELTYVHETGRLQVLSSEATPSDPYRITPDERFFLGKAQYEHKDLQGARATLLPLIDEFESSLEPFALVDTARILLFASIEHGDDAEIVRFFEIIKERDAQLFVPIEKVLRIGDAYSKLGEHERAMLIFRATLEETFGTDLKIVQSLDQHQQWLAGTKLLSDLVNAYPDLPVVRETDLAICDRLLQMASKAETHEALRKQGIGRGTLTGMGIQRLRRFLALHGQSSLASDAGLNLVSAFFDLEDHGSTAELCDEFAQRFKLPRYHDAFRYSQAVASWYLGLDEVALSGLLKVAESTFEGANGMMQPSQNRHLAYYIAAQIHHAQQDVPGAEKYYALISQEFPDAQFALQTLQSKELRFAEKVFRSKPGELPQLQLEHRNLSEVELMAFPVDLMTLYLREKDLSRVTEVNLAGISPTLATRVRLAKPSALRTSLQSASLDLQEAGAYLVMARGESEHASCLVLISDLEVQVQEFASGQVRVQVMNAKDGQYLREVDIRVIGSADQVLQVGKTDPRGLFVASGIQGRSTVIARHAEKHYAFHLGEREMQAPKRRAPSQQPSQPLQSFYLQNVIDWNDGNLQERGRSLDKEMQADRKGVQVKKVK